MAQQRGGSELAEAKASKASFEIESMRKLVLEYYKFVRRRLTERVPNALRTLLTSGVETLDEEIYRALRDKWTTLTDSDMQDLFSEPDRVQNTRRELSEKIETLKKAISDIDQLERQLMKKQ